MFVANGSSLGHSTDLSAAESAAAVRPVVRGKFLYAGEQKLCIRGVTYGPFGPDGSGTEFGRPQQVDQDFRRISELGLNAVRVYSVPPRWLLDLARHHALWVVVGIAWEQHVTFLAERSRRHQIEHRVREAVQQCAGHPAVLCYAIGNEIPSNIV